MIDFKSIDTPQELTALVDYFNSKGIDSLAMDFEEESNLHVYGEYLCIIQLFDGADYYIIDALKIQKTEGGVEALKLFLEGPIEKIMFGCASDASIVRKTLSIQLNNIFDVRVIAQALGFMGNLTGLIERNLHVVAEDSQLKKKYQRANWMKRPIAQEQLEYALNDVKYLFDLKLSLQEELKTLPQQDQKRVAVTMRHCAEQKHHEKPGWEKICNYKMLKREEKIYLRNFFIARDNLARKANWPATNVLEKQLLVEMAHRGTWEGVLEGIKLRYSGAFEEARQLAQKEINDYSKNRR